MLDNDSLQQPSPLVEVESTTTSDTIEYSTSPAVGDAEAVGGHCESDYNKLNKIADMECHCPDDVWGTRCIACVASGALNLSSELLGEAIKEIYNIENSPPEPERKGQEE